MDSLINNLTNFDDIELSDTIALALKNYLSTVSSVTLFEHALIVIEALKKNDKEASKKGSKKTTRKRIGLQEFLNFCTDGVSSPRLNLLRRIYDHIYRYKPEGIGGSNRPSLYNFGEDLELLRRLSPSLFEPRGEPCRIIEDIRVLIDFEDKELIKELGIDHPLFSRIRELRNFLRSLDELQKFISFYRDTEATYYLADSQAMLMLKSVIAWYKIILSLSCAYDRHCRTCTEKFEYYMIQGGPDIDEIVGHEDFEGLPEIIKYSLKSIQRLCSGLLTLKKSMDSPVSTIKLRINTVLEQISNLDKALSTSSQQILLTWWQHSIKSGLKDIRDHFVGLEETLDDMDDAFKQLDSESLRDKGIELLWSISLEEIYDNNIPIALISQPRVRIKKQQQIHISPIEKFDIKTLKKLRKTIFRYRKNSSVNLRKAQFPATYEKRQLYIRQVYDHFHDKFLDIPYVLKKKLFNETVKTLQDRLSLAYAADLLDTYLTSSFSLSTLFYSFIPPLILLVVAMFFSKWELFLVAFPACVYIPFVLCGIRPYIFGKLNPFHRDTTANLTTRQWLPGFVVPMALALSPFVLSDELKNFVYGKINTLGSFLEWTLVFLLFSLFAIWKLQSPLQKGKARNTFRILGILWPQALFFSFIMPIILKNATVNSSFDIQLFKLGALMVNIPQLVSVNFWGIKLKAFPASSLIFSVLCLFVAVFLEGFYRRR